MIKKITASTEITIQFYDVDSMKVAWHGNYVKFMETARCALLDKIHYNYNDMEKSGYIWPIVDIHFRYIRPMIFMQKVRLEATLDEYELGLKISYRFYDSATNKLLTKAESCQMAIDARTMESQIVSPKCLIEKVEEAIKKETC